MYLGRKSQKAASNKNENQQNSKNGQFCRDFSQETTIFIVETETSMQN